MKTTRIQRRRSKGYRLPAGAICVSRPGPFGNPFSEKRYPTLNHQQRVDAFRWWLMRDGAGIALAHRAAEELRGKTLACWCSVKESCHADVLIDAALGRLWNGWHQIHGEKTIDDRWVKVTRDGHVFRATIFHPPGGWITDIQNAAMPFPPTARKLYAGRTVLGQYATEADAVEAARTVIAASESPRLCTPRDIDRVRKENAERLTTCMEGGAA